MTAGSTVTACQFTDDELRVGRERGAPARPARDRPRAPAGRRRPGRPTPGSTGSSTAPVITDKGLGVPKVTISRCSGRLDDRLPDARADGRVRTAARRLGHAGRPRTDPRTADAANRSPGRTPAGGRRPCRLRYRRRSGGGETARLGRLSHWRHWSPVGPIPPPALASATSVAAEAIGMGRRKGRIAVGYDADLVVVDGDPSVDIVDLQRIRQVYVGGEPAWPSAIAPPHSRRSGGQSEAG